MYKASLIWWPSWLSCTVKRYINENAYLMFKYITETIYKPLYFEDMQGLKDDVSFLNGLLAKKNKKLFRHLDKIDFKLDSYLFTWIVCMFSNLKIEEEYFHYLIEYLLENKKNGLFTLIMYCIDKISGNLLKSKDNMDAKDCFTDLGKIFEEKKLLKRLESLEEKYRLTGMYTQKEREESQSGYTIFTEDCFDLKRDMKGEYFCSAKSGIGSAFKKRVNDENKFMGNTP